ncbi:ComEC/Rec2 family competence protein [uncultured Croceitalea sp.]|uniref:ComEC/Rec2 family competence protein n=1 Tax=uncultured Croceitalea sp. TaxID=1798908 RepID=UPI003305BF30
MHFYNFVSVKLSFFLILGILLGYYLSPNLLFTGIALILSLTLLYLSYRFQKQQGFPAFEFTTVLTTLVLGMFVIALSNPKNDYSHYSYQKNDIPSDITLKIREVLKSNQFSKRYIAEIKALNSTSVSGHVLLSISEKDGIKTLHVDDLLLAYGTLKEITAPLNPHQFDYKTYLKKRGVYHQLYLKSDSFVHISNEPTLLGAAANFRAGLIKKLRKQPFDQQELGVIEALLLGQRNDIDPVVYDDYKNAGAVHILAVSGLHIGILLLLLQFLLAPLEKLPGGKQLKLLVLLLLLWAFAFFAGLSPSIVRAVTMFSFIAYALHLNRPSNTFNIVALSLFFILLIKPMFLFQVGFQMSYAAIFAIIWIYPKLQRFWYPTNRILLKGWQLISVSCAAQLGVLPISLFYFHQFPALFFISNLVIIPILGLILALGVLVLTLTACNLLPHVLALAYNKIIYVMNTVVGWVAAQETFVFRNISFDTVQLVLAYFIVFAMIFALSKPKFKTVLLAAIGILSFQGYLIFTVYFVNQNEAIILANQTANSVLLHQNGAILNVYSKHSKNLDFIISNYTAVERIDSVIPKNLKNSYQIKDHGLYIMDSSAIYPTTKSVDYLVLTQSPQVNLERLIEMVQPGTIVVDASNYKSYIKRWKATCRKKEIPFHYTGEKGAYTFWLK